jgi:hypothetical protein
MDLIRKLFWVALTVVFTFCFVVLFENGTTNFEQNAKVQFADLKALLTQKPHPKGDADPGKP